MISCVRNNIIIELPQVAQQTWTDPETNQTYLGFLNMSWPEMQSLGWKEVIDNPLSFNSLYEYLNVSNWYYDSISNKVTRDYTINLLSFSSALTNCFNELGKNRETYEISGFEYNYYGIDVLILTDRESSQPKLTASEAKAKDGVRLNTDVWKFTKVSDNSTIVVQLSNADLLTICNYVFRKITDSYNLQSQIAWQMLGTEDTVTLKEQIINGNISLNPWL